ncbi:hypothetical protein BDB01DRAFT_852033 [Pilobolus umbonatus]|nr:hypothetical protein BDB01DRAFT_852033 [Pilobolus umbonatus]
MFRLKIAIIPATRALINTNNLYTVHKNRSVQYIKTNARFHSEKPITRRVKDWEEKFTKHPHLVTHIVEFVTVLESKGIRIKFGVPTPMQILRILNDPSLKPYLAKVEKSFREAKIEADLDTLNELSRAVPEYILKQRKSGSTDKSGKGDKKDVLNKEKDLLK